MIHRLEPTQRRCAFSIVEMLIVVGIIGILLALSLPAAHSISVRQKKSATMGSLRVLETVIEGFSQARTLNGKYKKYFGEAPPDFFVWRWPRDGPYHCEKFEDSTSGPLHNGKWDPGEKIINDYEPDPESFGRYNPACIGLDFPRISSFDGIRAKQPSGEYLSWMAAHEDYRSIETLAFYVQNLDPADKALLLRLPSGNKDHLNNTLHPDFAIFGVKTDNFSVEPTAFNCLDLIEVLDAWGEPLRYRIDYATQEWELRSAGPDGVCATAFTPEEQSDDVILRKR